MLVHRAARLPAGATAFLALAAAAAIVLAGLRPAAAAKLEEGQKALPFQGTDFLTGSALNIEESLGKRVILLDFGSIYCSSCMVTVPNLIRLRKKYPAEDLA